MDNRRFSARAEIGMTTTGRRDRGGASVPFLDRAIELTRLNWEVLAFIGLILLALFTRLWELGPRAMHHDESIHAYFSNYFLKTGDYTTTPGFGGGYDPTYHGPFLYHMTGLGFYLFGVTEATARLMPALFGVILVGLCWLMRPFIGRLAAVLAAVLVLFSPSISYYSRSLRHDIFALTGIMLLFVSILWFMRTHQPRWVFLGSLGLAVAYTSHELTFIVALIFLLFLVAAAFLYEPVANRLLYDDGRYGPDEVNPVKSAWGSLIKQKWTLIGGVLVFVGMYLVLFTSLFTKPQLVLSGIVEGFSYWFNQQDDSRGGQPLFYYAMLMFLYEALALFAGIGTIIYIIVKAIQGSPDRLGPNDDAESVINEDQNDPYGYPLPVTDGLRGLTLAFLAFWSIGSFIAFSLAGERMPWLTMQIALPFSLLAAAGLGRMLGRLEWRQVLRGGGIFLGVAVVLFIFAAFALIAHLQGGMPAPTGANADLQRGMRAVLLFLFAVGLLALSAWLAYKLMPGRAVKVIGLTFAAILLGYGIRSMTLLNWVNGDTPVELMVYTQSAPDVVQVSNLVKRLSRDETAFDARNANDVTGGRSLEISIDQTESITWPFDWYFRDQRNYKYFTADQWKQNGTNIVSPNVPVILASEETEGTQAFKDFIQDKYTTQRYVLNWWFPENAYKKPQQETQNGQLVTIERGDIGTAFSWLTSNGLKYILYRNPGLPLGSRNFYLHVRNDLAVKAGLQGATSAATPTPDPIQGDGKEYGMFELAPEGVSKGQFRLPRGITQDAQGNFYVVDTGNMRIQKFDATGKFVSIIGSGSGNGDGQFKALELDTGPATGTGPSGIAVDAQGNIYVADTWNHRVQKFGPDGKFLAKWGDFIDLGDANAASDPNRDSKFYGPRGVAVGGDGNVYVSDTGNKRVSIFSADGRFLRQISSGMGPSKRSPEYPFSAAGELNEPIGIAVDAQNNVYVADTLNSRIQKFDATGKSVATWPVTGTSWGPGAYLEPFLAVDKAGNLYATTPTGQRVLKYNASTGQLLGEKTSEGAVSLKTATGITVGADGTIYVVDTGANGVINFGKMP